MWGFLQITSGILSEVRENRDDDVNDHRDDDKNCDGAFSDMPFLTPHFTGTNI